MALKLKSCLKRSYRALKICIYIRTKSDDLTKSFAYKLYPQFHLDPIGNGVRDIMHKYQAPKRHTTSPLSPNLGFNLLFKERGNRRPRRCRSGLLIWLLYTTLVTTPKRFGFKRRSEIAIRDLILINRV